MLKTNVYDMTGKVVGEYPVDKNKKRKYFLKVAGICYAIAAAVAYMLLS